MPRAKGKRGGRGARRPRPAGVNGSLVVATAVAVPTASAIPVAVAVPTGDGSTPAFEIVVPEGAGPGAICSVQSPGGGTLEVVVPAGKAPGERFHVELEDSWNYTFTREALMSAFAIFDMDGTGTITASQLRAALQRSGGGAPMSEDEVRETRARRAAPHTPTLCSLPPLRGDPVAPSEDPRRAHVCSLALRHACLTAWTTSTGTVTASLTSTSLPRRGPT